MIAVRTLLCLDELAELLRTWLMICASARTFSLVDGRKDPSDLKLVPGLGVGAFAELLSK